MSDLFIRWLALPSGEIESLRLVAGASHGSSIVWWVAAAMLLALGSSLAYARCRPAARRWTIAPLALFRAAALVTIVLMLADVRAIVQLNQPVRPSVWLLIDGSESMSLVDGNDLDRSSPAPLDQVRAAVSGTGGQWLDRLQQDSHVDVFLEQAGSTRRIAAADEGPLDRGRLASRLTADGPTTALGSAIERLAGETGVERLAALIVISDFNDNAGPPVSLAARSLGVPVYAIGVGPDRPSLDVVLETRPVVRRNSQQHLGVLLNRCDPGSELRVRLWARPDVDTSRTADWTEASLIGEQRVRVTRASQSVEFSFSPQQTGPWLLRAEAEPLAAATGKPAHTESQVTVADDAVRVLMVDYEPNWEWRSLKRLLATDVATASGLRVFLRSADSRVDVQDNVYLAALPTDTDLLDYDVVVLGDMPAASLNAQLCESLRRFVAEAGGGLIVVSGPRFGSDQLAETAVGRLLPVVLQSAEEPAIAPFEPQPTDEAKQFEFTRFAEKISDSASSVWEATWYQPTTDLRPGSRVLFEHPRDRCAQSSIRQPLIALGRAGRGEVLYLGFNETWRLRRAGGASYRHFWLGAIGYLANNRLAARDPADESPTIDRTTLALEERATGCNRQLGRELAQVTGGKYYDLAEAGRIVEDIQPAPLRRTLTEAVPLWNNWPVFLWTIGLLLTEWWLRKRAQLP